MGAPRDVYLDENPAVIVTDAETDLLDAAKIFAGGASDVLFSLHNIGGNPCTVRVRSSAGRTQSPVELSGLTTVLAAGGTHEVALTRNSAAYLGVTGQCGPGLATVLDIATRAVAT